MSTGNLNNLEISYTYHYFKRYHEIAMLVSDLMNHNLHSIEDKNSHMGFNNVQIPCN